MSYSYEPQHSFQGILDHRWESGGKKVLHLGLGFEERKGHGTDWNAGLKRG